MKVLVIEDEKKTAGFIRRGLEENGFVVEIVGDGETGLARAKTGDFEIVVLDIMIPKKDGWQVLDELRRTGAQTPVLALTALDQVADRVRGLELGADDYLVKPFAFSELLARIRSVLRRRSPASASTTVVADLEIDANRQKAFRAGIDLELTPKEFLLLALLARRVNETLSREYIGEQVWGVACGGDSNVVDVHVRRLRAKADDPFERKLIRTVRGAGYRLQDH